MSHPDHPKLWERKEIRVISVLFAFVLALLIAAYFMFLRFSFSPLFQNMPINDAAAVVDELDKREIRYRIKNGGQDIYVASNQVEAIRLSIVNLTAPGKRISGFDLFDESEMGLSDFAQNIKYQRAIKGDLETTLISLHNVTDARVHIAMPERVLFRDNRSKAKASVTIFSTPNIKIGDLRIQGIQSLVASAIPNLIEREVVVLNSLGEIISPPAILTERPTPLETVENSERTVVDDIQSAIVVPPSPEIKDVEVLEKTAPNDEPTQARGPSFGADDLAIEDRAFAQRRPEVALTGSNKKGIPFFPQIVGIFGLLIFLALAALWKVRDYRKTSRAASFAQLLNARIANTQEVDDVTA